MVLGPIEHPFTGCVNLVRGLQLARKETKKRATLEVSQEKLQFIFRCGNHEWKVFLTQIKGLSSMDFVIPFLPNTRDNFIKAINKGICLIPKGFPQCACESSDICIVNAIMTS